MPLIARGARQVGKSYLVDKPSVGSFTAAVGGRHGTRTLTYTLVSLPLYLASELDRLLHEHLSQA